MQSVTIKRTIVQENCSQYTINSILIKLKIRYLILINKKFLKINFKEITCTPLCPGSNFVLVEEKSVGL